MNDRHVMKMVVLRNDAKVYVNFNKGYWHVMKSLRKLGFDEPHEVRCEDITIKLTQANDLMKNRVYGVLSNKDYFMDFFRAYQYVAHEKDFDRHLEQMFRKGRIQSLDDVLMEGNLYQVAMIREAQDVPMVKEESLRDMKFTEMTILNRSVLFTQSRIDLKDVPKSLYRYECQHDDDQCGIITMIGRKIHVNFAGTILSSRKIALDYDGYRIIDEDKDIHYSSRKSVRISEYMHEHEITRSQSYSR